MSRVSTATVPPPQEETAALAPAPAPPATAVVVKPAAARPRRWRRLRHAAWVLVPVSVLAALEVKARRSIPAPSRRDAAWTLSEEVAKEGPVGYFFIGSSRVACAVDAAAFEAAVAKGQKRRVRAVNCGAGFTLLVQHYLNLRNLYERYPDHLRGCVVFVEAPEGMPGAETWDGTWVHPEMPSQLVSVIAPRDFPGLWAAGMPVEEKTEVTCSYFLRGSVLFTYRQQLGQALWGRCEKAFLRAAGGPATSEEPSNRGAADLRAAGGVRNDPEGVENARRLAVRLAQDDMAHQAPGPDWDRTVVPDLVHLVHQAGGRVVFYKMPLHSVQAAPYWTALRKREVEQFRGKMAGWGTVFLTPDFSYSDEDFPDYWHLRQSRSPAFTRSLARAWLSAGR
jgi:hypothetical protein